MAHHWVTALADKVIILTCREISRLPASLHRLMTAMQRFFIWECQTGRLIENPAREMRIPRLHRKPPVFLSDAEITRLPKELQEYTGNVAQRDRIVLEIFLGTGIRLQVVTEVYGLEIG